MIHVLLVSLPNIFKNYKSSENTAIGIGKYQELKDQYRTRSGKNGVGASLNDVIISSFSNVKPSSFYFGRILQGALKLLLGWQQVYRCFSLQKKKNSLCSQMSARSYSRDKV